MFVEAGLETWGLRLESMVMKRSIERLCSLLTNHRLRFATKRIEIGPKVDTAEHVNTVRSLFQRHNRTSAVFGQNEPGN